MVFDVNSDGQVNADDVDIVHKILEKDIVNRRGGIGTYKKAGLMARQMVHIDCRPGMSRWDY